MRVILARGSSVCIYIYIYIYIYFFKKKQNRSHKDYKFISILLCIFDKIKIHEKN